MAIRYNTLPGSRWVPMTEQPAAQASNREGWGASELEVDGADPGLCGATHQKRRTRTLTSPAGGVERLKVRQADCANRIQGDSSNRRPEPRRTRRINACNLNINRF